jgi:hypothetical protein
MWLNGIADKGECIGGGQHELTYKRIDIVHLFHPNCTIEYLKRLISGDVKQRSHPFSIGGKAIFDLPTVSTGGTPDGLHSRCGAET